MIHEDTKQDSEEKAATVNESNKASSHGYIAPIKQNSQLIMGALPLLFAAKRAAGLMAILLLVIGVAVVLPQLQTKTQTKTNASYNACNPKDPVNKAFVASQTESIQFSWDGFNQKNTTSNPTGYLILITNKTTNATMSFRVTDINDLGSASYQIPITDLPGGTSGTQTYAWAVFGQDDKAVSCPSNPSKIFTVQP